MDGFIELRAISRILSTGDRGDGWFSRGFPSTSIPRETVTGVISSPDDEVHDAEHGGGRGGRAATAENMPIF